MPCADRALFATPCVNGDKIGCFSAWATHPLNHEEEAGH